MTKEELEEILNTYKWIKVKRFKDDVNLSWEDRFKALEEHHVQETSFLVDKIRELVKNINNI